MTTCPKCDFLSRVEHLFKTGALLKNVLSLADKSQISRDVFVYIDGSSCKRLEENMAD